MRHLLLLLLMVSATPCLAQSAPEVSDLRRQLDTLRSEQLRTAARMAELENALSRLEGGASASPVTVAPSTTVAMEQSSHTAVPSRLQLSGDMRLRYEANFSDRTSRNRDRGVLRARLRSAYNVTDWLAVGGQIATGDPDDPNSADVTLSNFADDLQVSLDQAWARATFGGLVLQGGKLPLPFMRTDLVWDGDVSPQGASATFTLPIARTVSIKATGLYFLIDEAVAGKDSSMIGGQLSVGAEPSRRFTLNLSAAYYDYRLTSLAGGDAGDFRSNLIAHGRYLSDYNLLDVIGVVTWTGLGTQWPVRWSADYVHNFGAAVPADSGIEFDLSIGKASRQGDWRFGYSYAQADVDAVLAAFSHDNIGIATNYVQHSLSVDYVPVPNVTLNATLYHYRPKALLYAGIDNFHDWLDRLRLNLLVGF